MKNRPVTRLMLDSLKKLGSIAFAVGLVAVLVWILLNRPYEDPIGGVDRFAFSPKGDVLAVIGYINGKRGIAVLNVDSKKVVTVLERPTQEHDFMFSSGVMFSPDGKSFVAWEPTKILFWDTETWTVARRLPLTPPRDWLGDGGPDRMILGSDLKTAAFVISYPENKRVRNETVVVYDVTRNEQLFSVSLGDRFISNDMTFSPDMRFLALYESAPSAKIIELASHRVYMELPVRNPPAYGPVCFSPDGQTLAVPAEDGAISFWDLKERKRRGSVRGHVERIREDRGRLYLSALAFSPDGKLLASGATEGRGSDDKGEIKIWNWKEGIELFSLQLEYPVWCVGFSPDERTLAYGQFEYEKWNGALGLLKVNDVLSTQR